MGQVNVKYRAYDHGFLFLKVVASYSYVDDLFFGLKKTSAKLVAWIRPSFDSFKIKKRKENGEQQTHSDLENFDSHTQ